MRSLGAVLFSVSALPVLCGCGGGHGNGPAPFPANFASLDDVSKVKFVMENASPDSVARFICNASLGKVPEGRIDTLPLASAYAYEHYADSLLVQFSREFDEYSASLPLADKMRVYYMAGTYDPMRLGYELGLEYVDKIRSTRMPAGAVREEIEAFRTACGPDSATYQRFLKGFKTVLKIDRGKDLPDEIYSTFIDY